MMRSGQPDPYMSDSHRAILDGHCRNLRRNLDLAEHYARQIKEWLPGMTDAHDRAEDLTDNWLPEAQRCLTALERDREEDRI